LKEAEEEIRLQNEAKRREAMMREQQQQEIERARRERDRAKGVGSKTLGKLLFRKQNGLDDDEEDTLDEHDLDLQEKKTDSGGLLGLLRGGQTKTEKKEEKKMKDELLTSAILNHHTSTIQQEGICELAFTAGPSELSAMREAQRYKKATKQPFMEMLPTDLSVTRKGQKLREKGTGALLTPVYLWFRMGIGEGVMTEVR
jgi:hypothetical protein